MLSTGRMEGDKSSAMSNDIFFNRQSLILSTMIVSVSLQGNILFTYLGHLVVTSISSSIVAWPLSNFHFDRSVSLENGGPWL